MRLSSFFMAYSPFKQHQSIKPFPTYGKGAVGIARPSV